MPSGKSPKKNVTQEELPEELIATAAAAFDVPVTEVEQPKVTRRRANPRERNRSVDRPRRRRIALPVLVVDETLLLPHMSIPYPVEDEESAMVLDRAMRMTPRQVLVLTERVVPKAETDDMTDLEFKELVADAIGEQDYELSIPAANMPDTPENPDEEWVPDEELANDEYELCSVGVIAEVGQRISRPGGHSHVILQGVARGVVH